MNELVEEEEILGLGGERLSQLLGADQVVFALKAETGYRIASAVPANLSASELRPRKVPTSQALAAGQPVLAESLPASWGGEVVAWAAAHQLGPVMVMPLISSGRLLGVAAVFRRVGGTHFDDADVQRAGLVVPQLAAALHVAALFEEVQEANRALEVANRHTDELLANMSHELRTPLNSILGFSQMLLTYPEMAENGERRSRYLNNITGAGRHLLGLINDILDLSIVEAGRMELVHEVASAEAAFDTVLASIQPLAEAKSISVERKLEKPIKMDADRTRLVQILFNLLSNAIKFTPEGGRVSLEGELVGGWAEIRVSDTGIGIAPEDQARIFGPFEQLEAGRSKGREGAGLGLALTKRLVELHGGSIRVESEPGSGSTFTVRLPLYDRREQNELTQEFQANGGPLVLVVEDDAAAARLLADHLGEADYRVAWARSAVEAIESARELQPAAITTDLLRPRPEGWDLIRSLRRDPQTSHIPVLAVSVLDDRPRALAAGAIDLLTKPVDPTELLELLEMAILQRADRTG